MSRPRKRNFTSADDFFASLPADERVAVEARAKVLMAQHLTLCDLRKARALTQAKIGKTLGIGQEHISRLESRADMLVSTLASYVEAMGGKLRLVAEFPDREPVAISLADVFEDNSPTNSVMRSSRRRGTTGSTRREKTTAAG